MSEKEYLILVEQGGCGDNDYWTDDGYFLQGTLCKDENGKPIHYRAVEVDSDDNGLRFRDIPRMPSNPNPEWEEMWLGDTHFALDLAQKRAEMIACPTKVVGAKWHDTTDPYEGCRVHALFDNPHDGAYAVITIKAEHLRAAFCKHEGLSVMVGDSDVVMVQGRSVTVDHKRHVVEDKEARGSWRPKYGNENEMFLADVKCKYCGVFLVEDTEQLIDKPRVDAIIKALRGAVL